MSRVLNTCDVDVAGYRLNVGVGLLQMSASVLMLLHLCLQVVDEGHAVNPRPLSLPAPSAGLYAKKPFGAAAVCRGVSTL
ncbi:hypothetical protein EVAR_9630_1 [Eumeta japonica]|uniref:Uncharacterized protein n=1 Tax=Eumeta variegata TaxID=151549 RepID=A0A4C1TKK5_EUMVA|nr:hypothetical protein EVAR_9630_1 [Eumeta japonica]